jgi:hypothetical protein
MTTKSKFKLLLFVLLLAMSAAACGADPKIIVPATFHGTAHIIFCDPHSPGSPIVLNSAGQGKSGLCETSLTKFAVKRDNGQSLPVPTVELQSTGDGIVVGATFRVP